MRVWRLLSWSFGVPVSGQALFSFMVVSNDNTVLIKLLENLELNHFLTIKNNSLIHSDQTVPEYLESLKGTQFRNTIISEENENLFNAMKAGARGYLLKSADLDRLITAIREVAAGDVIITPKMASRLINGFEPGSRHQVDKEPNEWSLRDKQVIQLVAQGGSIKEIGAELLVSETTVKAQIRTILEKFQVKDSPRTAVLATV